MLRKCVLKCFAFYAGHHFFSCLGNTFSCALPSAQGITSFHAQEMCSHVLCFLCRASLLLMFRKYVLKCFVFCAGHHFFSCLRNMFSCTLPSVQGITSHAQEMCSHVLCFLRRTSLLLMLRKYFLMCFVFCAGHHFTSHAQEICSHVLCLLRRASLLMLRKCVLMCFAFCAGHHFFSCLGNTFSCALLSVQDITSHAYEMCSQVLCFLRRTSLLFMLRKYVLMCFVFCTGHHFFSCLGNTFSCALPSAQGITSHAQEMCSHVLCFLRRTSLVLMFRKYLLMCFAFCAGLHFSRLGNVFSCALFSAQDITSSHAQEIRFHALCLLRRASLLTLRKCVLMCFASCAGHHFFSCLGNTFLCALPFAQGFTSHAQEIRSHVLCFLRRTSLPLMLRKYVFMCFAFGVGHHFSRFGNVFSGDLLSAQSITCSHAQEMSSHVLCIPRRASLLMPWKCVLKCFAFYAEHHLFSCLGNTFLCALSCAAHHFSCLGNVFSCALFSAQDIISSHAQEMCSHVLCFLRGTSLLLMLRKCVLKCFAFYAGHHFFSCLGNTFSCALPSAQGITSFHAQEMCSHVLCFLCWASLLLMFRKYVLKCFVFCAGHHFFSCLRNMFSCTLPSVQSITSHAQEMCSQVLCLLRRTSLLLMLRKYVLMCFVFCAGHHFFSCLGNTFSCALPSAQGITSHAQEMCSHVLCFLRRTSLLLMLMKCVLMCFAFCAGHHFFSCLGNTFSCALFSAQAITSSHAQEIRSHVLCLLRRASLLLVLTKCVLMCFAFCAGHHFFSCLGNTFSCALPSTQDITSHAQEMCSQVLCFLRRTSLLLMLRKYLLMCFAFCAGHHFSRFGKCVLMYFVFCAGHHFFSCLGNTFSCALPSAHGIISHAQEMCSQVLCLLRRASLVLMFRKYVLKCFVFCAGHHFFSCLGNVFSCALFSAQDITSSHAQEIRFPCALLSAQGITSHAQEMCSQVLCFLRRTSLLFMLRKYVLKCFAFCAGHHLFSCLGNTFLCALSCAGHHFSCLGNVFSCALFSGQDITSSHAQEIRSHVLWLLRRASLLMLRKCVLKCFAFYAGHHFFSCLENVFSCALSFAQDITSSHAQEMCFHVLCLLRRASLLTLRKCILKCFAFCAGHHFFSCLGNTFSCALPSAQGITSHVQEMCYQVLCLLRRASLLMLRKCVLMCFVFCAGHHFFSCLGSTFSSALSSAQDITSSHA